MSGKKFLLLAAACVLLTACEGAQKEDEKTSIRIGVSLYRGDDTFINNIRSVLEEKAKEYERQNNIKVTLDIQDAKGSQNTQNNQVERFISLGCDVLCINPVDRTAASAMIDKAMTAGIPVVFFNRQPVEEDMDRWDQLYYVGVVARESAILQGSIVVDQYRKDPDVLKEYVCAMRLGLPEEDFEEAMELQNIRGEQLEFFTEEYDRLVEESGEHLKVPEDLAERLYELEREYYRNTRYA